MASNPRSRRQQGSIRRRGKSFQVSVYAGEDPVTGRRHYLTGSSTDEAEAKRILRRLVAQVTEQRHAKTRATLRTTIESWLETHELEATTRETYVGYADKHIYPVLGSEPLGRVTPHVLERFYAVLRRTVRRPPVRRAPPRSPTRVPGGAAQAAAGPAAGGRLPAATVRQPATRDEHDRPVCSVCLPAAVMTCAICGDIAPCVVSRATGRPWCRACQQRWARCTGCDQVRPVRGGTRAAPLCSTCTRPEPGFWRSCAGCGQPGRLRAGRCARCRVRRRLHDALAHNERPDTVADWLDRSATPAVLAGLAGQPLTHRVLDELPAPTGLGPWLRTPDQHQVSTLKLR